MKYKLYNADFNEETGISTATIITDLGLFSGQSKLHEEDKDICSKFSGCMFAEARAIIKYGKMIIKVQKEKVKNLKILIDNLENMNNYNKNSVEARFIRKNYFIELNKLNKYKSNLNGLKNNLYNDMKNYREVHNAMLKKIHKEPNKK